MPITLCALSVERGISGTSVRIHRPLQINREDRNNLILLVDNRLLCRKGISLRIPLREMINFNIKRTHYWTVSRTELCRNNREKYSTIKFLLQYNIDTFISHVKRTVEYLTLRSYSQGKLDTARDHLYRTAWYYPILLIRKTFATRCRDLWHRHTPWHMVIIIITNVVGAPERFSDRNSDSTVTV